MAEVQPYSGEVMGKVRGLYAALQIAEGMESLRDQPTSVTLENAMKQVEELGVRLEKEVSTPEELKDQLREILPTKFQQ